MDLLPQALQVFSILFAVLGGIALACLPGALIARWILTPIDRAARHRKAAARFSISDFLCLFVAVQLPLTAVFQLSTEDTVELYWIFTVLTWLIAPVIWVTCARALSKAGVTTTWQRSMFLGLIMPVVYYGVIPFTLIGVSFIVVLFADVQLPMQLLASIWTLLAALYFASVLFVRWTLSNVRGAEPPISDLEHENELAREAMYDGSAAR